MAFLKVRVLVRASTCSAIALALVGCVTSIKSEQTVLGKTGSAEGQWRGKALVNNWKTKQKGYLDLDILAREPSQLRMEITGTLGTHVASIALSGKEVFYILTQEKRFVEAPATSDALTRLVPVRISPTALLAVLFERELPAAEWKCDVDKTTKLNVFCSHKSAEVGVKWLERNGLNRRIKIIAKEADIEMVLDQAKSKVELNSEAFRLAMPAGYRRELLNQD